RASARSRWARGSPACGREFPRPAVGVGGDDGERDGELVPIQELFATLLRSLNRSSKYEYDQTVQSRKDFSFLAALEMKSFLAALEMKPWEPIRCPGPHYRYGKPRICRRCGRAFYRSVSGRCHRNIGFCSDVCAEASRRELRAFHTAATIKARSEAAAVARAG